nr:eukaryotic translation initiation factor 3 subunit C like [Tanacetum cinerariifolium]
MLLNTPTCSHVFNHKTHHPNTPTSLLPKTLFPPSGLGTKIKSFSSSRGFTTGVGRLSVKSSLIEAPVLWAGRVCIFYALLKAGLAGSPSNPLVSSTELETNGDDLGFAKWFEEFRGKPEREAADKRKLVSKWHPTTKGTLRRNYRIPSNSEGRRLLKAIASLLSDDDHFRDATSHKGCQIRRESAHGETVCCNNVRALFDELPTPHLIVEITPFPAGPLTESDYAKAEKLEKVLRSGPSI